MSLTNEQIVEAVASKSLMEVMELVKAIEEKFGVSAAARLPWRPGGAALPRLLKHRPNSRQPDEAGAKKVT